MSQQWFSDDHATLGDRLAAAREAAGMNQHALAERLGVRLKTIREWENDLKEPRANRLQMLSALMGVTLRWLLTGEGEGVSPPSEQAAEPDPQMMRTLGELRSLRTEMLGMLERMGRLEKSLRLQIETAAAESAGGLGSMETPKNE